MHDDKMIRPGQGGAEQRGLVTDVVVPVASNIVAGGVGGYVSGRVSRPKPPPPPPPPLQQVVMPPGVDVDR
jgi:hypothetical protein